MKCVFRAAALLAVLFTTVFAASCGSPKTDRLAYQAYPFTAECTVAFSGINEPVGGVEFVCEMRSANNGTISFVDGELGGLAIDVTPSSVTARDGDGFTMPLDCEQTSPLRAVVSAFSLTHNMILAESTDGNVDTVTANCADGAVTITISDAVPQTLQFSDFNVIVDRFVTHPES